jgi:hypothetical protein
MYDEDTKVVKYFRPGSRVETRSFLPPSPEFEVEDLEEAMDRAAPGTDPAAAWVCHYKSPFNAVD